MRSKKNKSSLNKKYIGYIGVVFLLIVIIGASISNPSAGKIGGGLQGGLSGVSGVIHQGYISVGEFFSSLMSFRENKTKMEALEKENQKLRDNLVKNVTTQNDIQEFKNLKMALNYKDENYEENYVSASIVAKNDGNWYNSFTISAGKNQGIKKNGIVLSGKGLVGRIYEVSDNYSKAISVIDSNSSVSFEVLRNGEYLGVINQSTIIDSPENFEGFLKGYLFDIKYEVVPGDIIITSGLGIYPKGIQIGEVTKVIEDKNNLLKYIKVKPYVNFKKLDKVLVITPRTLE